MAFSKLLPLSRIVAVAAGSLLACAADITEPANLADDALAGRDGRDGEDEAPARARSGARGSSDASVDSGVRAEAGSGTGVAADCAAGDEGVAPPTTPAALHAWLQKRAYKCWARESVVHPSAGPHGGNVRTYVNRALDRSLAADTDHPAGAASVKELYRSGTTAVTGWAVSVKTQADSDDGAGWYWYEVFSVSPGASGAIEGQGKQLCVDCHAGGRDYALVPYPLR